ncbi:MAG: sensor histidine kinase, partial [Burkholderiales bacterium]
LLLPAFAKSGWLPISFLEQGPFGIALLKPHQLFGLAGLDEITHAMIWSMLCNFGAYVGVSLKSRPSATEQAQATLFVDVLKQTGESGGSRFWRGTASVPELHALLGRFLGLERADEAFASYARQRGLGSINEINADAALVNFAETLLAGAIGAASARAMVASVVEEEPLGIDEVMNILDETSQVIAYSRKLEQKSQELEAATTELRAANERLKELDKLKDDFVSTVSHELRTPLTSIRALSEILHGHPELNIPERSKYLNIIVKESERLTRLINQVLDLSKIESGSVEWNITEVDLKGVIEDAVSATSQLFKENKARLELHLTEKVPMIRVDRDRLMQVVINMLSNAVKFCDRQAGLVSIRLHKIAQSLRLDVHDNGPGINPVDQHIIFEKFRQAGDTMTEKPQGTGLGLTISRHIIEHFNGKLWVESEIGKGATFSFTLPLKTGSDFQIPRPELNLET